MTERDGGFPVKRTTVDGHWVVQALCPALHAAHPSELSKAF